MIASFDIGEKNFAYVIGTADIITEMRHINVVKKAKQTITESCDIISDELAKQDWSKCTTVLIEQQMRANVRAQRVSQHIWTWFRLLHEKMTIKFVPSTMKTREAGKMTYPQRKRWAVNETKRLLKDDTVHYEYLTSLTKQDDVADAFLQLKYFQRASRNFLAS